MKTSHEAEKNTTTGSSQQNEASSGTLSEGVRQQNYTSANTRPFQCPWTRIVARKFLSPAMQPFQENKQIKL